MKNFEKLIQRIDLRIERLITPFWAVIHKYFTVFSVTLLSILMLMFVFRVFYSKADTFVTIVNEDVAQIVKILTRIDKECEILDIRAESASIDFLTVQKFAGSMVGCLNLAHPKRWKGPYLKQSLTIQGCPYQIVRAKDGYFVIPGNGVRLPNNAVIGKNLIIKPTSHISAMVSPGGKLNYKGQALGAKLDFKIGDWSLVPPPLKTEQIEKINKSLEEFNNALPFAQLSNNQENV